MNPQPSAAQNGHEFAASAPHIGDFRKSAIVIPLVEGSDFFGDSPEDKPREMPWSVANFSASCCS
ncbi:hypothetical protein QUA56_23240 [Microcoleus sp. N3A4]|uniref:hypothetical protein n=1 Tax=Microcoleus sp. N3A4 TaxID=3055379 RepID=UPI002FD467A8